MLTVKANSSTEKTFQTWYKYLLKLDSNNFVLPGYTTDSIYRALILQLNNNGDIISNYTYLNPFFPQQNFIKAKAVEKTIDKCFIVANIIQTLPNGPFQDMDAYIIKIDSVGEFVWSKTWGNDLVEEPTSIIPTPDNYFIIGGMRHSLNIEDSDYSFQCFLLAIDTSGQIQWTWLSPGSWGLRDAARDMVLLEDGSLVIASGIGHEQQRPSVNVVYFDKAVFKLNPQRELEWEVVFKASRLVSGTKMSNIEKLENGSGFIVAGVHPIKDDNPNDLKWGWAGWIAKVSPDGDSLWAREYTVISTDAFTHDIYDLKTTPDGGIIICGEARDWSGQDSIPQQAWLMKLDSFGCLVPGCQLVDATEESKEMGSLLLYPNPARDYLNFFYRPAPGQSSREVSFRIFDTSGHELHRFEAQAGEATYIVPLWHWPPGVYFLQLLQNGLPVKTERFVVER